MGCVACGFPQTEVRVTGADRQQSGGESGEVIGRVDTAGFVVDKATKPARSRGRESITRDRSRRGGCCVSRLVNLLRALMDQARRLGRGEPADTYRNSNRCGDE